MGSPCDRTEIRGKPDDPKTPADRGSLKIAPDCVNKLKIQARQIDDSADQMRREQQASGKRVGFRFDASALPPEFAFRWCNVPSLKGYSG